jgi:hypothetical protein
MNFPDDPRIRKQAEKYLENLLAAEIISPAPAKDLTEATKCDDDSQGWASSLVSNAGSRCISLGMGGDEIPAVAVKMIDLISGVASAQRRSGQLRDADRTADRLTQFALRLVRSYGDKPESHMLLSEGYFQVSKNAWQREDYPAIEQALRQALESARNAVRLDPQHQEARTFVDRLLPRLALFEDGRSKSK